MSGLRVVDRAEFEMPLCQVNNEIRTVLLEFAVRQRPQDGIEFNLGRRVRRPLSDRGDGASA